MLACTRCGRWHLDAEKVHGKMLSCTEVKQYWGKIRQEHMEQSGHLAQITVDENGEWVCMKCSQKLL